MEEPNPYTPPGVAETEAGRGCDWRIEWATVVAEDAATLPRVDLETGQTEGDLVPVWFELRSNRIELLCLFLLAGAWLLGTRWGQPGMAILAAVFVMPCLRKLLVLVLPKTWRGIRVRAYGARWIRLRRMVREVLQMCIPFMFLASLFVSGSLPFADQIFWIAMLVLVGLGIWSYMDRPKVTASATEDGRIRLGPIHPTARFFLQGIQFRGDG